MLETVEDLEEHAALVTPPLAQKSPGDASAPAMSGAIAHARIEDVRLDLIRVEESLQLRLRLRETKLREFERSLAENGLIHPILVASCPDERVARDSAETEPHFLEFVASITKNVTLVISELTVCLAIIAAYLFWIRVADSSSLVLIPSPHPA